MEQLHRHYEALGRSEASRNLARAIDRARDRIAKSPDAGLRAPRPYPEVAREGRRWIKEGRYWFAYISTPSPIVVGTFFETADLPTRATELP